MKPIALNKTLQVQRGVKSRTGPHSSNLSRGGLAVLLFLIAQFVSMSRQFVMSVLGDNFNQVAAVVGYGSVALLPIAMLLYRNNVPREDGLDSEGRGWATLILLMATIALFYGLWRGYDLRESIQDYAPYLVIFAFTHLGAQTRFWRDLQKLLPHIVALAVLVNILGFDGYISAITIDDQQRVARQTLSYFTQATLDLWPLLLFLSFGRGMLPTITAAGAAAFALLQQILFQKRLGSVYVIFQIFVALIVIPHIGRKSWPFWRPSHGKAVRVIFFKVGLLAVLTGVLFQPKIVFDQFQGLMDRFQGRGLHDQTSGSGLLTTATGENDRIEIARQLIADFQPLEYLTGRGMGGHFVNDIKLSESYQHLREQTEALFLQDVGVFGRREIEIGILMPFLKGGFILFFCYLAGQYLALRRRGICMSNQTSTACWLLLLIENSFLLQGGGFIMSATFKLVVIGACLGRCFSKPIPAGF